MAIFSIFLFNALLLDLKMLKMRLFSLIDLFLVYLFGLEHHEAYLDIILISYVIFCGAPYFICEYARFIGCMCQVLFSIVREGFYPVGNFREVEMVNWTALLGLVHGVSVRKPSRNWIVHVEFLHGRSPRELFGLAKNLGDRVA